MDLEPGHNNEAHEEAFREAELASEMNVAQVHGSIMREREDPRDGFEPIPLWLVTIIMLIVFWAGMYLSFNSGGFRPDVFDPTVVSWTGGGATKQGPPDPLVIGKRLFTQNCVVCHQTSGQGVSGQFPPLVGSSWVVGGEWHGDNHLVSILLHGLQGPVQVHGATYNNAMPPWKQLKDEQIASILTYIRGEWGNTAPPITAEYVGKVRELTKDRSEPWTQAELQSIGKELVSEAAANPAPAENSQPPAPK